MRVSSQIALAPEPFLHNQDPKRTLALLVPLSEYYQGLVRCPVLSLEQGNETSRSNKQNKNAEPQIRGD